MDINGWKMDPSIFMNPQYTIISGVLHTVVVGSRGPWTNFH
jgi:hypothetical protein